MADIPPLTIELTPGEKAQTIESCRKALEEELRNLTGLTVMLSAMVHPGSDDADAREVARASVQAGWTIHRGGHHLWTKSDPFSVSCTSVHINPRKATASAEQERPEFPDGEFPNGLRWQGGER